MLVKALFVENNKWITIRYQSSIQWSANNALRVTIEVVRDVGGGH